ncbi:Os06g0642250 [Oryza sativa Japonica Group]|uniref:Os06g0642250 protein n=1 Tax=Oryza sativa subsp. japonica TaxID=39947 RepID=A0A0N7KMH3_ORYSJ|nr:hypothetical protein EE612_035607 [Oryza sativa]BAS98817.1 Os06g0642250 [Oryza sativa Japonica Group]
MDSVDNSGLHATFSLDPQEHVEQVLLIFPGGSVFLVLRDNGVQEREHLLAVPPHPARHPADDHGEARRRVQVRQARRHEQLDPSLEHRQELVPVLAPPPDHGAHRRVGGVGRHQLAEVHRLRRRGCRRRGRRHRPEQPVDLLLADGPEGIDAPGAEQLDGADLAELPPRLAVGREDDPLGALGEDEAHHAGDGARREGEVVRLHDVARGVRGGGDDDGELAEPEQHEWAVAPRNVAHGAVRERPG